MEFSHFKFMILENYMENCCRLGIGLLGREFMLGWSMCSRRGAGRSSSWGRRRMMSWRRRPKLVVKRLVLRDSLKDRSPDLWWRVLLLRLSLPFLMMWSMISRVVIDFLFMISLFSRVLSVISLCCLKWMNVEFYCCNDFDYLWPFF